MTVTQKNFQWAVGVEHANATAKHPRFHSYHEGYAVLLEEVHELWDEVRRKEHDSDAMRSECIQIAAMAMRFACELCGDDGDPQP